MSRPELHSDRIIIQDNNNNVENPGEVENRLRSFLDNSRIIPVQELFPHLYVDTEQNCPSEFENRLLSFFEDSNPRTFPAQETYHPLYVDTEQNCPSDVENQLLSFFEDSNPRTFPAQETYPLPRSSVLTTLKEPSEGISIQPPQIQSKEFESIYPSKDTTCQVLDDVLPTATPHSYSQFQVILPF